MSDTTASPMAANAAEPASRCLHCLSINGELAGLFGHDPAGHRVVGALLREGLTARWQLERATDLQLLLIRDIGTLALARIRSVFPEPAPAPLSTAPASLPFTLAPDDGRDEPDDVSDADRQRLALLARLPAEVDIAASELTGSESTAALWVLTAISRTDPRIWRHVRPQWIAFARMQEEEGFTAFERMLLRVARSLYGHARNPYVDLDLPGICRTLDDDQWAALMTGLAVRRAGLRGEV